MHNDEQIHLKELIHILARFRILIVALAVTGAGLGVYVATSGPKAYEARNTVVLSAVGSIPFLDSGSSSTKLELSLQSLAVVVQSETVAKRIVKRLGLDVSPSEVSKWVRATPVGMDSLTISALAPRPQLAADVANAAAQEFLAYRVDQARAQLTQSTTELKAQIDTLQVQIDERDGKIVQLAQAVASLQAIKEPTPQQAGILAAKQSELSILASERNNLIQNLGAFSSRYQVLDSVSRLMSGGGSVVAVASVPTRPASTAPERAGLLGLIVGASLGAGLGFTRNYFDDRIRDVGSASRAVGAPVLAVVPHVRKWRDRGEPYLASVDEPRGPAAEAYRTLGQALRNLGLGSEFKTILVTSGGPSAGKTSTVANLGVALARGGARVVAISADLLRPRLHKFFGAENEAGLGDFLAGVWELKELSATAVPNFWILPSGGPSHSATGLLDSPRLDELLAQLQVVADVVLIDGPPMSAGADAPVLASRADATVVCITHRRARAGGVKAATTELLNAGARRLTAVLTNSSPRGSGRGRYGYGYGYGYAKDRYGSQDSLGNGNELQAPSSNGSSLNSQSQAAPGKLVGAPSPRRGARR